MSTKMTARIPVTPDLHKRLRDEVEESDASTYDAFLRGLLQNKDKQ